MLVFEAKSYHIEVLLCDIIAQESSAVLDIIQPLVARQIHIPQLVGSDCFGC